MKTKIVILIAVISALIAGYISYIHQNSLPTSSQSNEGLLSQKPDMATLYKQSKYRMVALLKPESVASKSADIPVPQVYSYWLANLIYMPLPDLFLGEVPTAKDIKEYRRAKKLLVESLKKRGINPCDLQIEWARPAKVPLENIELSDIQTDGCK